MTLALLAGRADGLGRYQDAVRRAARRALPRASGRLLAEFARLAG
jgi:hypothetical protein